MKENKFKIFSILCVALALCAGCTKEEPLAQEKATKASDGLSVLEKAKIARVARKNAQEEKRKLLSTKYSNQELNKYVAHVYFENELVESDALNLWVPSNYIAVLYNPIVDETEVTHNQKLSLINRKDSYETIVDLNQGLYENYHNQKTFCKDIVVEKTKHTNVNMLSKPTLLESVDSSICHLHYQNLSINKYVNEFIEVSKDGKISSIKTLSSKHTLKVEDMVKTSLGKAISPDLKTSTRHVLKDFFDTEIYKNKEI